MGDSQTPQFDIYLFDPCGRRRRSRYKKGNSKKKVQKKVCLRTMPSIRSETDTLEPNFDRIDLKPIESI